MQFIEIPTFHFNHTIVPGQETIRNLTSPVQCFNKATACAWEMLVNG